MDGTGVVEACSTMHGAVHGKKGFGEPKMGLGSSSQDDRGRRARRRSHRGQNGCDGLETFEDSLCLDVLFFVELVGLCFAKGLQDRKVFGELGKGLGAVGNSGGKLLGIVELNCDRCSWLKVWHFRRGMIQSGIFAGRVILATFAAPFRRCASIFVEYNGNLFHGRFDGVDGGQVFLKLNDFVFVTLACSFGVVEVYLMFVASQAANGFVVVAGSCVKRAGLHEADSGEDQVFRLSLQELVAKEGKVSGGCWRRH